MSRLRSRPGPVVKWAGGKAPLVGRIAQALPPQMARYHEPFAGGAAVFFALAEQKRFKRAVLADRNDELMETYRALKADAEQVIQRLVRHQRAHSKEHYYALRALDPSGLDRFDRAARVVYLNKAGFNGLYRVNSKGQFNVPFGDNPRANIADRPRLLAAASALKRSTRIITGDFAAACEQAEPGDAVYFDPPYDPLSQTSNFTRYAQSDFGASDQERLAALFARLAERGVCVVLSNSDTPRIRQLYRGFRTEVVGVRRSINSKADGRGKVNELLVFGDRA